MLKKSLIAHSEPKVGLMINIDYRMHTTFCDGENTPEEMVFTATPPPGARSRTGCLKRACLI